MKRILIIDESEVIRETLALILGREFIVSKRSLGGQPFRVADAHDEIDLLILGIAPQWSLDGANLARLAAQLPCAVLFICDSKIAARRIDGQERIACLTKPFNPYELQARVGQLLAGRSEVSRPNRNASTERAKGLSRYLEYPYLTRSAASLAQRFAATRLPVLIAGDIGCGQEQVVRAFENVGKSLGASVSAVSIDAREFNAEDLAQKSVELAQCRLLPDGAPTLLIENLDKCPAAGQWRLLNFLRDQEETIGGLRYLTTTSCDLLERVYHGDFLDALYYKLATLTLKLPPLRERTEDMPALVRSMAGHYAAALDVVEPVFLPRALERLRNYLWFGNLNELETVIARTLTLRGGGTIDAGDLVFDFGADAPVAGEPFSVAHSEPPETGAVTQPKLQVYNGEAASSRSANGTPKPVELSIVIHELAHELKNPMVTIKTFAQLLGDRYDDESFRTRFQEIVGGDIERMDDLLEVMIEFADFAQPKRSQVALGEKLRCVAKEIQAESTKRQTRFEWKDNGNGDDVRVDESQLTYVLRNVLSAVVAQAKLGSEIDVEVGQRGSTAITYLREGARVASITQYLSDGTAAPNEGILPLRILLAKQLFERNGGRMVMDQSDPEKDILRLEFPIG
jgi:DNA-binding NtrC family response regulator